jgi:hypothetical protein
VTVSTSSRGLASKSASSAPPNPYSPGAPAGTSASPPPGAGTFEGSSGAPFRAENGGMGTFDAHDLLAEVGEDWSDFEDVELEDEADVEPLDAA